MKRTLTLRSESLSDLTGDELASVHGGIPTFEGPICLVLNLVRDTAHTVLGSECNTL